MAHHSMFNNGGGITDDGDRIENLTGWDCVRRVR